MRSHYRAAAGAAALVLLASACGSSSSSRQGAATTTPSTSAPPPTSAPPATAAASFLGKLNTVTQVGSTVPANGDVNPYGVAVVPTTVGKLTAGDTLVSNFNAMSNVQGTGTTIVEISSTGSVQLFSQISPSSLPQGQTCPGGIGLTTALAVLPGGWVVVGSMATANGGDLSGLLPTGCLIVLDDQGKPTETITNANIIGPWDMAVASTATSAELFVSNALGGNTSVANGVPVAGNCIVVRINLALSTTAAPKVTGTTVIGTGFPWVANKAALILAPTGLALGPDGTLYVDNTETNIISAIANAATRSDSVSASAKTVTTGGSLNAPLGMMLAPNGDLVVVNGNDGNAVEITPTGTQIDTKTLVSDGAGDLFGLTATADGTGILLVNDGTNALDVLHA